MILVDTSVWIALLRGHTGETVDYLRQLLLDGDAALAPVILQELLQGAPEFDSSSAKIGNFVTPPQHS